jgi:primosomal protein N' (replication factor Y)
VAAVTGGSTAVGHFTASATRHLAAEGIELRVAGPAPLLLSAGVPSAGPDGADVRTLLFIPYAQASTVTRALRAAKAAAAAKRTEDPVQLRLDGLDVL